MSNDHFLAELLSAAGDAAYCWDIDSDRIEWCGAWNKVFGDGGEPPVSSARFFETIFDDDRHLVFGMEVDAIDREYRLRGPQGNFIWVHERGIAEFRGQRLARQCGLLRIIEKPVSHETSDWSGRDDLTGCFNRAHMTAQIDKALEGAKSARRMAAYLVIGIDKMSFVNEAVGTEAGDGLLRSVASRLRETLPTRAILGRVGGDMFGVLLPDPLSRDFPALIERLLQDFRHRPVITPATSLHITVSIGVVRLPSVAKNASEAMIFAEQALHAAHQRGRNLFVEYVDNPERMQENRQLLDLGERVKLALKQGGLRLAYQPIVDSQTGQTLFYEALARLTGDDGKLIAAAQFVPVVEQLGLALEFDRHVLQLAVREMEENLELNLAINISGLTAAQTDWPDHMRRALASRPHVTRRLIVEITETAAIVDVSETRRFVETLRELGGRVSLDDFGAGFTSIRHLRALSVSIMKIDKDLLHELLKNAEQQHLVRMLAGIARGLGIKTVAEGVETAEIAEWLRAEKIDMMQGYYFGKPSLERPWAKSGDSAAKSVTPETRIAL